MTDNHAQGPAERTLSLMYREQLAILATFQTGAKYGLDPLEIAKRFHEQSRDGEIKLAWHAFQNEMQMGGNFAGALAATGFFTMDVQRVLNILIEVKPATEAAITYLSAVTPREP